MIEPPLSEFFSLLAEDPLAMVRRQVGRLPVSPVFYIFGAGNIGRKMLRGLVARGCNVRGFLDNNSALRGQAIESMPIFEWKDLRLELNAVCVVSIWHYQHDPKETAKQAESVGFRYVIHFSALASLWELPDVLPNYAVDNPAVLFNQQTEKRFLNLWHSLDDESRCVLSQIIKFHALPDPYNLPLISTRRLPFDPIRVASYVDGGAYVGDDFASRLQAFKSLKEAVLIEPDPHSFQILSNRLFPGSVVVCPLNAALGAGAGLVNFQANGNWGSRVVADKDGVSGLRIPSIALDAVAVNLPSPMYVKMDLEGHELEALKGSTGLLERMDVILSVTLEHRALDLFEIPEFLSGFPNRSLFLYPHDSEFSMDLVIYSVPTRLVTLASERST